MKENEKLIKNLIYKLSFQSENDYTRETAFILNFIKRHSICDTSQ